MPPGCWRSATGSSTTPIRRPDWAATRSARPAGLEAHKSTEHNIDVYALFRLIAAITGDKIWLARADHAAAFVRSVWNPDGKFFWTGSDDGTKINKDPLQLPEDVQTWSYLAAHAGQYADSIDWAAGNLATTDTPLRLNSVLTGNTAVSGVAFASGSLLTDTSQPIGGQSYNPKPDSAAVWFEGTAHLALALAERNRRGDRDRAAYLLENIRIAQAELGTKQTFGGKSIRGGIVAASSPMDTGFGFSYLPNLHWGRRRGTSWRRGGANPYPVYLRSEPGGRVGGTRRDWGRPSGNHPRSRARAPARPIHALGSTATPQRFALRAVRLLRRWVVSFDVWHSLRVVAGW